VSAGRADVLFFPWSVGAGHTGRCLVAARVLREAGLGCAFACDPTGGGVEREGFAVLGEGGGRRARAVMPAGGYLAVASLDAAYASAGYYHPARIRAQVEEDRSLVRRVRPRLVVTHMHPTAAIAARLEGSKVASIVEADFLPPASQSWMPWILAGSLRLPPFPPSAPAFGRVLEEFGLPAVASVGELLFGDRTWVASAPELDPLPPGPDGTRVEYVGPLIWRPDDGQIAADLARLRTGRRRRVYVTLGSGEVSPAQEVARAALGAAEAAGWSLLLATGYADHHPLPCPHGSLVRSFGGLGAALEWADAVVCHGGHSTVLAALLAGKPIVVAPAISENEANGRTMVEATGAGFLLYHSEADASARRLRLRPRYPELTSGMLSAESLTKAVSELLEEPAYGSSARRWSAALRAWTARGPLRLLASLDGLF
jgi:UDP:flavonoid glycosyltransferase YjiC (YdhE family)